MGAVFSNDSMTINLMTYFNSFSIRLFGNTSHSLAGANCLGGKPG